jgi:hypothetical protein
VEPHSSVEGTKLYVNIVLTTLRTRYLNYSAEREVFYLIGYYRFTTNYQNLDSIYSFRRNKVLKSQGVAGFAPNIASLF